ncbi:beta-ketoacyl-[acyl-carrier-protein] synthase family protein [Fulvivirga ulvae]|uniref:beta-ketoacyl-[acyl-carrier-protein] synthase family protein n=1 Tax=Fulvivirga ulvae TaxID=2904245 RepID=UPI001F2F5E3E|nr:beta-ketoacyl-[acyl-carrier-protein] synthase family protein [Fulvivirga ulvae]UII34792.1 beta-ketoacyl-[acyl-carrier-protein] synthase family protein [Fulvivirga ulvae]
MHAKVYVSGYGIISALGVGVGSNLSALQSSNSGISAPSLLDTSHKDMPVGELKVSNAELTELAGLKHKNLSRTALMGVLAAREALEMAGLTPAKLRSASLINGTSVGGMDISELACRDLQQGRNIDFKSSFQGHDCGYSTAKIADTLGLKGPLQTISTACSSSANTIMNAGRMIRSGMADCVIAGGSDALSLFTLNGFNSLKILDQTHCKPFDEERQGLNLGEGAAFLVLESEQSLRNRGGRAVAQLTGYGNANDAYHQTASSPEGKGALLAMKKALKMADMAPGKIDYINAHGTGTANNDLSESRAIKEVFKEGIPVYSSTKAFTGHALGAAGAIEAVFSLLAIQHQMAFPNLNLSKAMNVINPPVTSLASMKIQYVLSNSFGFGGNCSSLIFANIS